MSSRVSTSSAAFLLLQKIYRFWGEMEEAKPFEMFDVFAPTFELLAHLLFEEFVMVILGVLPLFLGLVSALHVMTGITKSPLDMEGADNVCSPQIAFHCDR